MEEVPEVARIIEQERIWQRQNNARILEQQKMLKHDKNANRIIKFGCCEYINEKFKFKPGAPTLTAKIVDNKIIVNLMARLVMEILPLVMGMITVISHDKSFKIIVNICDFWLTDSQFTIVKFGLSYVMMTGSILSQKGQFCFQAFDDEVRIYNRHSTYVMHDTHFWDALIYGTRFHRLSPDEIRKIFGPKYVSYYKERFPWHFWFEDKIIGLPLSLTRVTFDDELRETITMLDDKFYEPKAEMEYNRDTLLSKSLAESDLNVRARIDEDIRAFDKLENIKNFTDLRKFETSVKSNSLFYTIIHKMGWYRHFHCFLYILSLGGTENRYKVGYSTQTLAEFKTRLTGLAPDCKIVVLFEGYIILEHAILNNCKLRDLRIPHANEPSEVIEAPLSEILSVLSFYTDTKICKLKRPIDIREISAGNGEKILLSLYNGDLLTSIDSKDEDEKNTSIPFCLEQKTEAILLDIIRGKVKFSLYNKKELSYLLYSAGIGNDSSMSRSKIESRLFEGIKTYINTNKKSLLQHW